jgi:hypothetical protein
MFYKKQALELAFYKFKINYSAQQMISIKLMKSENQI